MNLRALGCVCFSEKTAPRRQDYDKVNDDGSAEARVITQKWAGHLRDMHTLSYI